MANIKFSQFTVGNTQSDIDFVVGYKGPDNVQISPTNLLASSLGNYLPLAGGTMTGDTLHNDNVKDIYGAGADLQIYHDATNNIINGGSTGINIDTYGDLNIGDLTVFNTYSGGFKVDMTAARQGLYNFEEAQWQLYSTANNEVFLLYSGNVKLLNYLLQLHHYLLFQVLHFHYIIKIPRY